MDAETIPTTPSGYIVLPAGSQFEPKGETPVEVAWAAVVGVQVGTRHLSLAQDTLRRAARVVRHGDGAELGAAMLLYLAQIGFRPAGDGKHVEWPPIRDGAIDLDRRRWRRPYTSALTSDDLYRRLLPAAEAAVLWDETAAGVVYGTQRARHAAALTKLPSGIELRAEDGSLHDGVRWHTGAFAYPSEDDAGLPVVRQEMVDVARKWATAPRSHRLSDALRDWILGKARDRDAAALATALRMLREGYVLTHATIRHHQHRALEEVLASGAPRWEEVLAGAVGMHELLYDPIPLFGFETWQFTVRPGGVLRITLPEIVGLGREVLRRGAWLEPLMVAFARRDEGAARHHLDRLRQLLALLTSNPETLLMRDGPASEDDAWVYLEADIAVVEPDDTLHKGPVVVPSDEELARGDPRRHRPDEEMEQDILLALAKDVLRNRSDLWEAFYLVEVEKLSYREAAPKLGLKSASAVKDRVEAAKTLLQQDPHLRDWRTHQ